MNQLNILLPLLMLGFLLGYLLPTFERQCISKAPSTITWLWGILVRRCAGVTNFGVVCACFYSIFVETDLQPHYLLGLSDLQTRVQILVCTCFAFDLGLAIPRPHTASSNMRMHHALGIVGCAWMIHKKIGGGMMMRLLLDVITDACAAMVRPLNLYFRKIDQEELKNGPIVTLAYPPPRNANVDSKSPEPVPERKRRGYIQFTIRSTWVGEKVFWVAFFVLRICWYPYVLAHSSYEIYMHEFWRDNPGWSVMLLIWAVYSTYYHFVWLKRDFKWRAHVVNKRRERHYFDLTQEELDSLEEDNNDDEQTDVE